MSRNSGRSLSRSSFRPSVYTTGVQPLQAYGQKWGEGGAYGDLFDWVPDPVKRLLSGGTYDPSGGMITTPAAVQAALPGEAPEAQTAEEVAEELGLEWEHGTDYTDLAKETAEELWERVKNTLDPPPPPWYKRPAVWLGVSVLVVGGGVVIYKQVKKG